jgi:undecaprenyl-diphosphatase
MIGRYSGGGVTQAGFYDLAAITGGSALVMASAVRARRLTVSEREMQRFRRANDLPDALHVPAWVVMQLGSLGGVWVVAAVYHLAGRAAVAKQLALVGTAVWGGVKLVKPLVGRGRPSRHLDDVRVRGRPQSGGGFPSGHAAVSVTMALVGAPVSTPAVAAILFGAAAATSVARMYVGAHLPLDVAGGVGIGLVAGGITRAARAAFGQ